MRKCTAWSVLLHSVRKAVFANGGTLSSRANQKEPRSSATPFIINLTWRQLRLGVDKPASKPTTKCTRKLISGLRTRGTFWGSVLTYHSARYRLQSKPVYKFLPVMAPGITVNNRWNPSNSKP